MFPFHARLLRSVYALAVSALTEHTLSFPTASRAGPTALPCAALPLGRTRYSASPKHLHGRSFWNILTCASLSLSWGLSREGLPLWLQHRSQLPLS